MNKVIYTLYWAKEEFGLHPIQIQPAVLFFDDNISELFQNPYDWMESLAEVEAMCKENSLIGGLKNSFASVLIIRNELGNSYNGNNFELNLERLKKFIEKRMN